MNIFVSYRRNDTRHIAGRLADKLERIPEVDDVFIDVDDIFPGDDFAAKINSALAASDICLIIIGEHWTGTTEDGADARIFNEDDFVRREVAAALASKKKVIPVLVDGAAMPTVKQLPKDIQHITRLNATFVRHTSFDTDVNLVEAALLARRTNALLSWHQIARRPTVALFASALRGLFGAAILLVVVGISHQQLTDGRSLEESLGGEGLVWFLIATLLAIGTILSIWLSSRR